MFLSLLSNCELLNSNKLFSRLYKELFCFSITWVVAVKRKINHPNELQSGGNYWSKHLSKQLASLASKFLHSEQCYKLRAWLLQERERKKKVAERCCALGKDRPNRLWPRVCSQQLKVCNVSVALFVAVLRSLTTPVHANKLNLSTSAASCGSASPRREKGQSWAKKIQQRAKK